MKRHARWTSAGLGLVAVVTSGCADDFVDPFQATSGMTGSSGDTGAQPDDDGQDDVGPADSTGSGGGDSGSSGSGGSESGGTTMMVSDGSSSGEPPITTGSSDGGESSSSGGEESSSGDPPPDYEPCPEGVLPNDPLPSTVNASSAGEDSEFSSTCGGGGAPDVAWLFTAPADGDYTFDTQGSTVDTVLYVLDGECTGPQLQCDDDGIVNSTQSMLSVSLVQGQTVTVVADSFGLQGGNVQLTVREGSVSCPVDIGSAVPQTVSGQTLVATNEFSGSCGFGSSAADQGYLFTPPQDATYTFEITNNTFDTLLYILDGECSGNELACNNDLPGTLNGASGLSLELPGGQPVTIVVDGSFGGGTFDVNIGMLSGTCPDEALGNMAPPFTVSDTTVGEDNATTGTCGGLTSNDYAYTWTAPYEATFSFDTIGSGFDTVVYVLDGACSGPELGCSNDTLAGTTSSTIAHLTAGQEAVIVVDGNGAQGNFDLNVGVDCPAVDLGSTVPQVYSGDTLTGSDAFLGSCNLGAAPDEGYTFTAPTDGTYTFEIANNSFDTILYALDGVCGGAELACNDNLIGAASGESGFPLALSAGQQITLIVDGSFGGAGTFDLLIGQLNGTCPDEDLGSMAVPFTVSGSTVGEDNSSAGSCGGLGSNDYTYTWTAPFEAGFSFDTTGSSYDTVVYVRDGSCTGTELGCNNDTLAGNTSSTIAHLGAGEQAVIVVDGNAAEGDFNLNVDIDCPAFDLGNTVPQVHSADTLTGSDAFLGSCNLGAAADEGFTFTAPADGTYTFETANNNFDTILYALDAVCGGTELACNDNLMGAASGESGFPLPLTAGQEVTIIVDGSFGGAGTFDLVVGQLSGTCPDEDLGNMAVPFTVNGTTAGEDNSSAGSCGGLGANDYTYTWTATNAATYRFSTEGSLFDTVVYVRDGATCGGAELNCSTGTGMSTAGATYATLAAGQTVNIFVDGEGGASGALTLSVEEAMDSGNCCFAHAGTGCDDPIVEACVCGLDPFCCNSSWDGLCEDEAINDCGAVCP